METSYDALTKALAPNIFEGTQEHRLDAGKLNQATFFSEDARWQIHRTESRDSGASFRSVRNRPSQAAVEYASSCLGCAVRPKRTVG